MDGNDFDKLAQQIATGAASRRAVLKRLAGGTVAALGGLVGLRALRTGAQPGCRREGHPCEGNQECCPGLVCQVTGPGNATRCAAPPPTPTPTPTPPKCKYENESCDKYHPCCNGYYCDQYKKVCKPKCKYENESCDKYHPCCKGYYCSSKGYCKRI